MDQDHKTKVAVGMSGGVDSSVAALLLKNAGYEVVGFFMKLWHDPCGTGENACCDERALMDARKVADQLDIPFYVVDARQVFKKEVTDYFIDEYKNLRTPNPCVICNQKIKFGWLLDFAQKAGCDYLATGHYARVINDSEISNFQFLISNQNPSPNDKKDLKNNNSELNKNSKIKTKNCRLLRGADETKDQSYFLYRLNQEQLSHIIFPLGEMAKEKVRKIAKESNLSVHEKKESQEVCFVEDDYRDFLRRNLTAENFKSGRIVDTKGKIIGKHDGLINYTIGQRKNVNQELRIMMKGEDKAPLYVVGFNKEENQLFAGGDKDLWKSEFIIENAHWINPSLESRIANHEFEDLAVKIRYRSEEVPCEILPMIHNSKFIIRLSNPARAIAPGQSAVFYQGEEILGGGIIASY